MIKLITDLFSGKIEKVALPGQPGSYAELCEKMDWPLDATLIFDEGEQVADKALPIKNPLALTVVRIPEGGDDAVGVITGLAMVVGGVVTENPALVFQGILTLAGTAYAHEQRKKLEGTKGPGQDDFNAISARLNKNQYGQPMPIFIGRGRFSPDMSLPPYQRMEGQWERPRQITYATYTFGDSDGVSFSDFKSNDIKLEGTDGVVIKTGAAVPQDNLVDTGEGAQLSKPTEARNEPVATYSTKAQASRVEIDIVYAAGLTTTHGNAKQNSVPFTIETKTEGGEWEYVEFNRLMWSSGLGGGGGLNRPLAGVSAATMAILHALEVVFRGNASDGIRAAADDAEGVDRYIVHARGRDGTPHRGTLAFDIPSNAAGTAVRLTFKVPWDAGKHRAITELSVEQFRSYYPDTGDYSGQHRVQVQYASDGPWSRQLPPLTAHYQATVEGVPTSNPADWLRYFLTRAGFPATMIEHASIALWRTYCADQRLEYNRVLRGNIKIADLLVSLCQVGHAKLAPIRGKLGVILFNDDTVVREFTLDDQLKTPPMSASVARKPKIKGLEIAYLDMETLALMPLQIGTAPFERVQIPGITLKSQAERELKDAWGEMQINYPIVSFSADDSALDLYRGQRINVHGQAGVFSGAKICRVLSVTPNEEAVKITARVELTARTPDNVISPFASVRPVGRGLVSHAGNIKLSAILEGGKAFLDIAWKNYACSWQHINITNESGGVMQIQTDLKQTYRHEIPLLNQLYTLDFTPGLWPRDRVRSIGSRTETKAVYVDVEQLMDRYRADTPKVRGLRLIHTDPRARDYRHQFSGSSCTIGWEKLKAYPRYRVRIYDHESDGLLRSTSTSVNRYHYSIEKNKADTAALRLAQTATRTLRISVAGLSDDQTTGRVGSIVVYNRLPEKPRIAMAVLTPGFAEIKIISTPTDPDFMGYLVWQGMSADFAVVGNRVDSGNCVKLLAAQSSSFTINVPPGQTHYFKVAAFDDFTANPQKLNVSDSVEITGVKLLDIPDIESRLKVGWNRLEFNDGKALVDANGNPVYDLGDATPEVRTRFQQFLAAGLRGLKPPFKAWHADLIDGGMITTRSLGADKIRAGAIEAEHLSSNSSWSAFLSSHEMDVHNIYYDRYQYGADGHLLTQPDGTPHLKPGGGKKLFDYIEGKVSAPLGQFQYLEVEMGGLVQSFSKHIYRHSRNFLRLNIGGGNPAGSNYAAITAQNRLLGILPLNRNITIPSALGGAARVISAQELTGTIMANSRVDLSFERNHLDQNEHTNANWRLFLQQRLLVTFEDGSATSVRGARVDAYGAETNAVQTINPNLIYLTLVGQPPLYQRTSQLSDVFDFNYGKKIRSLELSIWLDGLEAYPTYTATYASRAVKALARKILITGMDLSAVCMLDKTKKPGGTNGLIPW